MSGGLPSKGKKDTKMRIRAFPVRKREVSVIGNFNGNFLVKRYDFCGSWDF